MPKRMQMLIVGAAAAIALPLAAAAEPPPAEGCQPLPEISGPVLFADNCTVCHGPGGKGGGPLAKALGLSPPDLTMLASRAEGRFPSGHVLSILRNGGGRKGDGDKAMPAWTKIFAHECGEAYANQAVLELDKYLRTIQATGWRAREDPGR